MKRSPLVFGPDKVGGVGLARNYISRTRAFFALSDLEVNLLPLFEIGIAGGLDFRVMDKQVLTAAVGGNKSKPFFSVKPFYCTCTHLNLLRPINWP